MIEVEKPFIVSDEIKSNLLESAEFIKSVKNNDVYYDTEDWSLFRANTYFRKRNGLFELKRPVIGFDDNVGGEKTRIYDEIDDQDQIREILQINKNVALSKTIPNDRYQVLAEYSVSLDKYRIYEFVIDVDSTSFGYDMVEIELMVDSADMAKDAEKRIQEFAKDYNLKNTARRGKLQEYCFRKYPEKFRLYIERD